MSSTAPRPPRARATPLLALLLALAVVPYFLDLGGSSIWDANEAFYVETPREMMERGDYVSPTFNYEPRLNKPVLSYWIVAGFYHLFGVSPGVQRIPIAIAALVILAVAFGLAWAAADPANPSSPDGTTRAGDRRLEAALWAAAGLAVTPRLLMFARRIFIDIYITMFLALTLLCFALAERLPARRRPFLVLMYLAIGLGVLTKGPVAVVLPGLAVFAYLAVYRELGRLRTMMIPTGAAIVAALVLPYCVLLYARHGWDPIVTFILGENVARYTEGVGVDAERPYWFYLPVVLSDAFPWSLFLFVAGAGAVAAWRRGLAMDPAARVRTLLWVWIGAIVLFFSASAAKQDLYIFPIVPAVAALAGVTLARPLTAGIRWTTAAIGAITLIAGAGIVYLVGSAASLYVIDGARLMGTAGVVGGTAVVGAALARRTRAALLLVVATFVLLDWIFVLQVLPGFERYKPVPAFARALEGRLAPEDQVVTYDEALPSLVFYLRRRIDPYFDASEFVARFGTDRTVYAVLSADNYRDLAGQLPEPTCVLARRPTFDVKLKNMLAQHPLPELLLVTNRCR